MKYLVRYDRITFSLRIIYRRRSNPPYCASTARLRLISAIYAMLTKGLIYAAASST